MLAAGIRDRDDPGGEARARAVVGRSQDHRAQAGAVIGKARGVSVCFCARVRGIECLLGVIGCAQVTRLNTEMQRTQQDAEEDTTQRQPRGGAGLVQAKRSTQGRLRTPRTSLPTSSESHC